MGKCLLTSLAVSAGIAFIVAPAPSKACSVDPMLGSICLVGFNFCPRGFTEASGQLLSISQNSALFALFGTIYGGDGRTTFALPDLRGRMPIHAGTGPGLSTYSEGQRGGVENVTIGVSQMPAHNHTAALRANSAGGTTEIPAGNLLANSRRSAIYNTTPGNVDLDPSSIAIGNTGSGLPQENRQPYLTMRYCVAITGVFPSRN